MMQALRLSRPTSMSIEEVTVPLNDNFFELTWNYDGDTRTMTINTDTPFVRVRICPPREEGTVMRVDFLWTHQDIPLWCSCAVFEDETTQWYGTPRFGFFQDKVLSQEDFTIDHTSLRVFKAGSQSGYAEIIKMEMWEAHRTVTLGTQIHTYA